MPTPPPIIDQNSGVIRVIFTATGQAASNHPAMLFLQQAADVAGEASKVTDGNILTILASIIATIFGALTLTQRSQVDTCRRSLPTAGRGETTDVKYERARAAAAEAKEDKCLDRLPAIIEPITRSRGGQRERDGWNRHRARGTKPCHPR
jgi:hypothetical protein